MVRMALIYIVDYFTQSWVNVGPLQITGMVRYVFVQTDCLMRHNITYYL